MYKYRKPLEAHEIEKLQELSQLNFSTMNETDVREEYITPLLTLLGYKKNSDYLATIALINTLKNNSKYIKNKNIKMKSFTYSNMFEEYECSLLTKEDLLSKFAEIAGQNQASDRMTLS